MDEPTWEFLFPANADHPLQITTEFPLIARQVGNMLRLKAHQCMGALYRQQTFQGPIDKADWFHICNGTYAGAEHFQDKDRFAVLVRKIGYRSPLSFVVPAHASPEQFRDQIEQLDTRDQRRFCKPLWGVFGRGAEMKPTVEATLDFLAVQQRDYLVQTFEEPLQDWRYVLHRDITQVRLQQPPLWRLAIQKVRPIVIGDGVSTLCELYARQTEVPLKYRQNYCNNRGKIEGGRVPRLNEAVPLLGAANMEQGAYPSVPQGQVLATLDRFFLQFLLDIEREAGIVLGSFGVDVGVTDTRIFERPYDHQRAKASIVFYEYQLPFTLRTYTYSPELFDEYRRTESLHPVAAERIWCRLRKENIHFEFYKSMLLTGALLQERNNL